MPDDPYIARREQNTVALELLVDDAVVGTVNTVLEPEDEKEAHAIARTVLAKLEAGALEPTASAIEPFATKLP